MINATTINTLKLSTNFVLYHKAMQNTRGISPVCDNTLLCSHYAYFCSLRELERTHHFIQQSIREAFYHIK